MNAMRSRKSFFLFERMSPARWGHPDGCPPAWPARNFYKFITILKNNDDKLDKRWLHYKRYIINVTLYFDSIFYLGYCRWFSSAPPIGPQGIGSVHLSAQQILLNTMSLYSRVFIKDSA